MVTVVAALVASAANHSSPAPDSLRQRLQAIASSTVLFGHQSVGANVLDGLGTLARQQGVDLRIAQVQSASELRPGTFGHLFVAENGDPRRKLASFATALHGKDPDFALVKFCYLDFDANTDAQALFAAYDKELRTLRAEHPHTKFVHVTVPLVAAEGIARSIAKRLLGKPNGAVPSNARRDEFNELIRSTYRGEPIFDLARVESTDSSSREVSATLDGRAVPMLAAEYSDDGGHLNAEGRLRAALALVDALAGAFAKAPGTSDGRVGTP